MPGKTKTSRPVDPGGDPYFEGSIHTQGGDFVAGDQNKVTIGSVSGSTVVVGNHNTVSTAAQAGASLPDLAGLLAEMRALLPQARLDDDTREVVEGSFKVVAEQLKKPAPKKAVVLPALKQVAETLGLAAGAGDAIQKLIPLVQQAIAWAQALLK